MKNRIYKVLIIGVLTVIFGCFPDHYSYAQEGWEEWENKEQQALIDALNTDLSNHPYMIERGYQLLPERSDLGTPESKVVAGTALVGSTIIYIIVGSSATVLASVVLGGGLLSNFFLAVSEGSLKFWFHRDKFRFTILDRNQTRHPGSCLVHSIINENFDYFYEYDACYLILLTGYEDTQTVKIPQTVDGQMNVHETFPLIGRLDDWLMGQTKVVGNGVIHKSEVAAQ